MRKAAKDATSLLFMMQIPQLMVSPTEQSVKTAAAQEVAIFVDYVKASEPDVRGLRPEDVARVEVLDYPDDPRFESAPHVVNFIMRKYEWDGYTKISAYGKSLTEDYIDGSLYSKFAYKKMTFDAYADARTAKRENKYRENIEESYRDFYYQGKHYDNMSRFVNTDHGNWHSNLQNILLRASYGSPATFI